MPAWADRVFLWDDDLSGFGVVAMPSRKDSDGKDIPGAKTYVVQFRQQGHKYARRMKLGQHGRLTPDEARSAAKKILGAVEGARTP
jgi:hypothetical protein